MKFRIAENITDSWSMSFQESDDEVEVSKTFVCGVGHDEFVCLSAASGENMSIEIMPPNGVQVSITCIQPRRTICHGMISVVGQSSVIPA